MQVKSKLYALLASAFALFSFPASAQSLSDLTAAISFSEVGTAIMAVALALAGIYVLWKGAGLILRAIRGL